MKVTMTLIILSIISTGAFIIFINSMKGKCNHLFNNIATFSIDDREYRINECVKCKTVRVTKK